MRALGRLVEHDPRSRDHAHPEQVGPASSVLWPRLSPILDQGQLGSCTANAMAGWLGCGPHATSTAAAASYDETFAVDLYSAATHLDPFPGAYPPDDTGSSGLAVAKAAKRRGLISSYSWCFTTAALIRALQTGPVIVGVPWYEGMDSPEGDAEVHPTGQIVGGHEFLIRGYESYSGMLLADNSWGTRWGWAGSFRLSLQTWDVLRRGRADVTVPHL